MTRQGRLILVSNREPYVHERTKHGIRCRVPVGGLVTALDPVMQRTQGVWIAWGSGNADAETSDSAGRLAVPEKCPKYTLRRVWLSTKEVTEYYFGFCNRVLWPVSHMFQENAQFKKDYWESYKKVNERFTHVTLEEMRPGDNLWVQDVHFSLLPAAIREEIPDASIAHFWHIPFPPWETFSTIPWRKEILNGLLGSDLLGFHTQAYVDNFISNIRKEFPDAVTDGSSVELNGHVTRVRSFPIGIDYQAYRSQGESENINKRANRLRNKIPTEHLIIGVDRLDYTKGILNRFLAFERFLESNPRFLGKVSFIQVASPTRSIITEYKEMKKEVEETVGRVNGRFQQPHWTPIIYMHRHVPAEELLMMYKIADVAMVTPVIDGMNLVAKEYVTVNDEGVLILSEFAGASEEMGAALIVNPYDVEQTARAIERALSMSPEERARHAGKLREIVQEHDVYWWLDTFMEEWGADVRDVSRGGEGPGQGPVPPRDAGLRRDAQSDRIVT